MNDTEIQSALKSAFPTEATREVLVRFRKSDLAPALPLVPAT